MSHIDRRIWPFFAWASPIIPAFIYYRGDWGAFLYPYGAAMIFGIFGLCYFLNAMILSTRIRYFDHLFGHDRVIGLHARMAFAGLILILIHRQLKVGGGELLPTRQITLGYIALIAVASIILITVLFMVKHFIHRLRIFRRLKSWVTSYAPADYSKLKILHNILPFAAMTAVVHVLLASTTSGYSPRLVFISVYALTAAALYIRFKFIRPFILSRNIYTISDIRSPGNLVTEVRLTGRKIKFKAGQYAYWRLKSRAVGNEEHPFTISSAPDEEEIGFSAKSLGDYTSALKGLKTGDKAIIDGPYGKFTLPADESAPVLFLAGGIGITPFLSMVQNMADIRSMRSATLIWSVSTRENLVYDGEFLKLMKRLLSFRYKPVINKHDEPIREATVANFESGRINGELISRFCPDLVNSKTTVYICGPDPMREAMVKILRSIGVSRLRIRFEKFSLG